MSNHLTPYGEEKSSLPSFNQGYSNPRELLSRVFGFESFRGLQEEIIRAVMDGNDSLVLMPTGGGKSLCYQLPGLCRPGTALVVSPLIALMDDQVAALRQLGIQARAWHSEQTPQEGREIREQLSAGQLDFLYISPERLISESGQSVLQHIKPSLIAIDEAHCVSVWGHEFRPEYRKLAHLGSWFPQVPRIALTATADMRTRNDILHALGMEKARIFEASFYRPNLHISAQEKTSETRQMLDVLSRHVGQASIIYCGSRKKTERVAAALKQRGWPALAYHAGLDPAVKSTILHRFRSGEPLVIVATIAFGMGIDRPDVRLVLHLDMPDSPESYYQQIGRAGRDGDPSQVVLLYGGEDSARARHWLSMSTAPAAQKQIMRQRLEAMVSFTETTFCRTHILLQCFGEAFDRACMHCDNCLDPPEKVDVTEVARMLLSAIYRTGQNFGATHIISVLQGRHTEAVVRHGHDQLSLFGIGKDYTDLYCKGVIRQLLAQNILYYKGEYSVLAFVNETVRAVLRGEHKIWAKKTSLESLRYASTQRSAKDQSLSISVDVPEESRGLFTALKQWRLKEAEKQDVPPYIIFHDSVLRDIARLKPTSLEVMGRIKGVGQSKRERYGADVLRIVRNETER